ncbi:hypothetical protein TcasGA2_TC007897 [Tribolium castaneum]|uniref:Uncharacterized protein n=1 Tax=Tribolium castaneum TaxID=7070 RepID=D2A2X8_TRICA|nr:hypothetical protein TcasGA2_TC007897 [Tribolium castaneum]
MRFTRRRINKKCSETVTRRQDSNRIVRHSPSVVININETMRIDNFFERAVIYLSQVDRGTSLNRSAPRFSVNRGAFVKRLITDGYLSGIMSDVSRIHAGSVERDEE